ncbi:MAG: hypothetical protein J6R01_08125 [Alistipes sp.]|nr:hypothetical protein [Alistipes sp.]
MNIYDLPTVLTVGGVEYAIRTDFRAVIDVLKYYADTEYESDEKALICLMILYEDFDSIPCESYNEALERAVEFIDYGKSDHGSAKVSEPAFMDWEQDAPLIISAVNAVAKTDIRSLPYLHWWSFLSWYFEIPHDCLYSTVLCVRQAKRKGKLESWQKEFYKANRDIVDLKKRKSAEETAAAEEWKAAVNTLFGKK